MAKETTKEIRISQPYTIQLIEDERKPGEIKPAQTIERALIELRTLRQAIDRKPTEQQPVGA